MPATQRASRFSNSATDPYPRPANRASSRGEHFARSSPKRRARIILWHRFITRTLGIKPSIELPITVKKEQITPGSHRGTPNGLRQTPEQLETELSRREIKLEPASPKSPTPAPISQARWSPTLIRSPSELISTTPSESLVPPLRDSDTFAPSSPATDVLTPPQSDTITPLLLESPEAQHQFPRRFNPRTLLPAIDAFELAGTDPHLRYTFDRPAVARTFRRLRDAYGSVADSLDPPAVANNLRSRTSSATISITEGDMPVSRHQLLNPLYGLQTRQSLVEGGNGDVFDVPAILPSPLDAPLAIPDTYHLSPTRNYPPTYLDGRLPLAFSAFNPNVRSAFEETRPPSPFYPSAPAPDFQFTPPLGSSSKRVGRLEELAAAVCRSSLSLLHQSQMEQTAGSAVERSAVPSTRGLSLSTRQASAGPETAFSPRSKQPASDSLNAGS